MLNVLKSEYILTEILRLSYLLQTYTGLLSFFTLFGLAQRISLLLQNKPYKVTYRQDKLIVITAKRDVCFKNKL
jgi:hypothetical protein